MTVPELLSKSRSGVKTGLSGFSPADIGPFTTRHDFPSTKTPSFAYLISIFLLASPSIGLLPICLFLFVMVGCAALEFEVSVFVISRWWLDGFARDPSSHNSPL